MSEKKHISLLDLQGMVKRSLDEAFPVPVWVSAEIAEIKVNQSGHCYLELVEKGGPNSVPKAQARAVVWRSSWQSLSAYFRGVTGSGIEAGMKVLLKVHVTYHELYGFSLQITDVDPSYTLGDWERQRQETIAQLQADGVFDMNRELELPHAVQRIAVVSSAGAAGYRDFMQEIGRFPYRVVITLFESVMQGHATEESVIASLEAIAGRSDDFDAVVVIRGGGSQSDLAAFNSYRLCCHIAQFPLPVITGIGHDKDRSVADMVAAVELKTPTAVAGWIGERLAAFDRLLDELAGRAVAETQAVIEREKLRLERAARVVSAGAVEMTRKLEMRIEKLNAELARRAGEYFIRQANRISNFENSLAERPLFFLSRQAEKLVSMEKTVALRRPENILSLGFAIVRSGGKAVRDASLLTDGQQVDISLAKGNVTAKIIK